jgi:hypothetical protein
VTDGNGMISHRHKCIFIHIPRCGGTSVEEIVWPGSRSPEELWMGFVSEYRNKYQTGGLQHLLATQVRQEVGPDTFAAYFKFSFVRNPFDKVVSQFVYMQRRKNLRDLIGMSPDDSLSTYLDLIQRTKHVQWEEQWKFLCDEDGQLLVDFVGRFETFEADVRAALKQLAIELDVVPHANKSIRERHGDYYDEETRQIVASLYSRDFELFGYSASL